MKPKMEFDTASLAVIGVDIGKDVFHLVGFGADGKIAFRRRIRRLGIKDFFEKLPPCTVGMEACLSAHFVSRTLRALGHEPRIIPVIYVKPFVKGQKNDYNDAEAIAEAALRPNLRFVQEKSQDQLDLQACHRVRALLASRRTATINQIRAFLIEQYCLPNATFDRGARHRPPCAGTGHRGNYRACTSLCLHRACSKSAVDLRAPCQFGRLIPCPSAKVSSRDLRRHLIELDF